METAKNILRMESLRCTDARLSVLNTFLKNKSALSQPAIESAVADVCDRVTIYRVLSSLLEHGIIHKVPDDKGVAHYALCPSACHEGKHHHHERPHFKCKLCNQTSCIEQVSVATPALPEGFTSESMDILIQGICPNCQ